MYRYKKRDTVHGPSSRTWKSSLTTNKTTTQLCINLTSVNESYFHTAVLYIYVYRGITYNGYVTAVIKLIKLISTRLHANMRRRTRHYMRFMQHRLVYVPCTYATATMGKKTKQLVYASFHALRRKKLIRLWRKTAYIVNKS
uniref:Uncharacterized protein n=1 Tax=Trichogramma kaykai TaxID=54128 RepID=A0ABD2WE96_9HYME